MGPDLPPNALTGVVEVNLNFCFLSDVQDTALAARESGAILPPFLQEDAAESKASVTSESSGPPVPVEIRTAHFPMAARIT